MTTLPISIPRAGAPPIKCQGIKTKLVPFICGNVRWSAGSDGRWVEPFLGSGVVALNLAPERALLCDANHHVIGFHRALQQGEVTPERVREFLTREGRLLAERGEPHYYAVRERFNASPNALDLLFLSRSCFNGVMRFNGSGGFNVPFCRKPERFRPAYVTKIVNQIACAADRMSGKDWRFVAQPWEETLAQAGAADFVYLDPPYIGRHTGYFGAWTDDDARSLAERTRALPCGYALSMWLANAHRENPHVAECWQGDEVRSFRHFYHVGSLEKHRGGMLEGLVIRPEFAAERVGGD